MCALMLIPLVCAVLCERGQGADCDCGWGGRPLGAPWRAPWPCDDTSRNAGRGLGSALPLAFPMVHSAG